MGVNSGPDLAGPIDSAMSQMSKRVLTEVRPCARMCQLPGTTWAYLQRENFQAICCSDLSCCICHFGFTIICMWSLPWHAPVGGDMA